MAEDVKQFLFDSAIRHKFDIKEMETDIDHAYMLIQYPPSVSVSTMVMLLKMESTRSMWLSHRKVLGRYYWKEHTLWPDGYFYCSIGEVSEETIRHYIQNQG